MGKGKTRTVPKLRVADLADGGSVRCERTIQEIPDPETYDAYINACYGRVLQSKDEKIRNSAADSLFHFYMKKREYEKAGEYLNYFSEQDPAAEKKKRHSSTAKQVRSEEAYKTYEQPFCFPSIRE